MPRGGQPVPLIGRRFGALVPIERAGSRRRYATWLCQCDCGQQIVVRSDHLLYGIKKACGVNHRWYVPKPPSLRARHRREYRSWDGMHRRCKDPADDSFQYYGARGIKVCRRWDVFVNFMLDMGPQPSAKHSIERRNVNGNYTPKNCCWATAQQQARNRRDSVYVRYEGKRVHLCELVERLGLTRSVVYGRLKLGWSLAEAIGVPVRNYKKKEALDKT